MKSPDEQLNDARQHLKRTGGPALPGIYEGIRVETSGRFTGQGDYMRIVPVKVNMPGMTLLDHFAAQSLAGIRAGRELRFMSASAATLIAYTDAEQMIIHRRRYEV